MGYPTCTEAAALRNLARAERASRRTQERETSLTSPALESTCSQDDETLENYLVDAACQCDETGNMSLLLLLKIAAAVLIETGDTFY